MKLESSAFEPHGKIPAVYTCDGKNIHPPLTVSGVPSGTYHVALIMHDPDAVSGDFVHWVVWGIRPATTGITIDEGNLPPEVHEGWTDFGTVGYGGPCPPSGTHRYHFRAYALEGMFRFDDTPTRAELDAAMKEHILDQALLIGLYERPRR